MPYDESNLVTFWGKKISINVKNRITNDHDYKFLGVLITVIIESTLKSYLGAGLEHFSEPQKPPKARQGVPDEIE